MTLKVTGADRSLCMKVLKEYDGSQTEAYTKRLAGVSQLLDLTIRTGSMHAFSSKDRSARGKGSLDGQYYLFLNGM